MLDRQSPDAVPRTADGTASTNGLRWDTAFLLHETAVAMNPDNFVVRPHRRWVETYAEPDAWNHLSPGPSARSTSTWPGCVRARRQ